MNEILWGDLSRLKKTGLGGGQFRLGQHWSRGRKGASTRRGEADGRDDGACRKRRCRPSLAPVCPHPGPVLFDGRGGDGFASRRGAGRVSLQATRPQGLHRIGEGRGEGLSAAVETQLPPLRPEFARLEYSGRGDDAGDQFRRRDVKSRVPRPAGRIGHPHPGASPF